MTLDKQHLFIIGSPRSGTTWLQIMIGAHPLVCTTVELTLYSRYTAPWIKAWRKEASNIEQGKWNQGLPFVWTEDEFYDFLREFVGRVYEQVVATNPQATHILDKHPGYSEYVQDIKRILPDARFIHLVRDGRDVVISMLNARKKIGFGPKTLQRAAVAWKKHAKAARKASQYTGQYLEVKYEDLLDDGVNVLESIFDFCNLPTSTQDVIAILNEYQFKEMKAKRQSADEKAETNPDHYQQGKAGNWQTTLNPIQIYLFHKIAGDLLCELGYESSDQWVGSKNQRLLLAILATVPRVGYLAWKRIRRTLA